MVVSYHHFLVAANNYFWASNRSFSSAIARPICSSSSWERAFSIFLFKSQVYRYGSWLVRFPARAVHYAER